MAMAGASTRSPQNVTMRPKQCPQAKSVYRATQRGRELDRKAVPAQWVLLCGRRASFAGLRFGGPEP